MEGKVSSTHADCVCVCKDWCQSLLSQGSSWGVSVSSFRELSKTQDSLEIYLWTMKRWAHWLKNWIILWKAHSFIKNIQGTQRGLLLYNDNHEGQLQWKGQSGQILSSCRLWGSQTRTFIFYFKSNSVLFRQQSSSSLQTCKWTPI